MTSPEDEVTQIICGGSATEFRMLMERKNKAGDLEKMVTKLFDRRFKAFRDLPTKEAALQHSQMLVISKTVEYMNLVSEMETQHLKSLQRLNDIIDKKEYALFSRDKELKELKADLQEKNNMVLKSCAMVTATKDQLTKKEDELQATVRELEATIELEKQKWKGREAELKDKYDSMKRSMYSQVDAANKKMELIKTEVNLHQQTMKEEFKADLEQKVAEIQNRHNKVVANLKYTVKQHQVSITNLTQQNEKLTEQVRKLKKTLSMFRSNSKITKIQAITVGPLIRQNKSEILTNRSIQCQMDSPVRPSSVLRKFSSRCDAEAPFFSEAQQSPLDPNRKRRQSNTSQKRASPRIKNDLFSNPNNTNIIPQYVSDMLPPQQSLMDHRNPRVRSPYRVASPVKGNSPLITNPSSSMRDPLRATSRTVQSLRPGEDRPEEIMAYYLREYQMLLEEVRVKNASLEDTVQRTIQTHLQKYEELEKIYESRPSREEDIDYIKTLIDQNMQLMALCSQSDSRIEGAYEALRQCKAQLAYYRKTFPMDVNATASASTSNMTNTHNLQILQALQSASQNLKLSRVESPLRHYRPSRKNYPHKKQEDELMKDLMEGILSEDRKSHSRRRIQTSVELGSRKKIVH